MLCTGLSLRSCRRHIPYRVPRNDLRGPIPLQLLAAATGPVWRHNHLVVLGARQGLPSLMHREVVW